MVDKPIPRFELNESSDLPLWVQIRDRFIYLVDSGYYVPGDQLPSVRKLASEMRISYNTVSKAYMSLEREGRIKTRHGSGAFVADAPQEELSEVDALADNYVSVCAEHGLSSKEMLQVVSRAVRRFEHEEK